MISSTAWQDPDPDLHPCLRGKTHICQLHATLLVFYLWLPALLFLHLHTHDCQHFTGTLYL